MDAVDIEVKAGFITAELVTKKNFCISLPLMRKFSYNKNRSKIGGNITEKKLCKV